MHFAHNCLLFGPHSIPSPRHQPLFFPPLEYPPQISPARYAAARRCQKISRHKLDRIKSRYGTLWPGGTSAATFQRKWESSTSGTDFVSYLKILTKNNNLSSYNQMTRERQFLNKVEFLHQLTICSLSWGHFWQICLTIQTNTFDTCDKYIWKMWQIHLQ